MVKKSISNEDSKQHSSSCKYTGVRKRKWGKWVSEIRLPNSRDRIWLGSYDSPEKAARAFDAAQYCLRGRSANFNFPDNPPEIAGGRSMTPAEIQAAAARFANTAAVQMDGQDHQNCGGESENQMAEDDSISYSPSISEGTITVQMDSSEAASFQEQLSLSTALGSGNYVSDFGYINGFEDFTTADNHFFTAASQQDNNTNNFDYCGDNETYDASIYQGSYLWNF